MVMGLILSITIMMFIVLKSLNKKMVPTDNAYVCILVFAMLVGLWSVFAFAVPGAGAVYEYIYQGKVDALKSEIDTNNPSILPPMALQQFSIKALPSALGVIGAISYILLAMTSLIRQKIFYKWIYITIGWNLSMWILHLVIYPYCRPLLPTGGQNMRFLLMWGLPSSFSILFSIFWLNLLLRKKVMPLNSQ